MDGAPNDWEIIMLCYHSDLLPTTEYTLNNKNYWSTAAYIIKKSAAEKITANNKGKGHNKGAFKINLPLFIIIVNA